MAQDNATIVRRFVDDVADVVEAPWICGLAGFRPIVAARDHAIDTGKNRLRGHVGSDGSQLQDRYKRYSNDFSMLAENWAYIQDPTSATLTPRNLVESWMKSPGHRANILDPTAKKIGVGLYRIGVELYAVQCFSAAAK